MAITHMGIVQSPFTQKEVVHVCWLSVLLAAFFMSPCSLQDLCIHISTSKHTSWKLQAFWQMGSKQWHPFWVLSNLRSYLETYFAAELELGEFLLPAIILWHGICPLGAEVVL